MSPFATADSAELAVLAAVVDDYCKKHGLSDEEERDETARRVFALFQRGIVDPAALALELEAIDRRARFPPLILPEKPARNRS